jgi:integrase/recombinase XerD
MKNDIVLTKAQQHNQAIYKEYVEWLIKEKKAATTVASYSFQTQQFLKQINKIIDALTYEDVGNYLHSQLHLSKASRSLTISVLRSFFRFCVSKGYMAKVLIKKRWRVRLDRLLPKPLDRAQRAELRIVAEHLLDQDRALIEFILSNGCRVNGVSALNIGDFNFHNNTVNVMGKGSKPYVVNYSDTAAMLLQKISQGRYKSEPMFLNHRKQRISNRGIYDIIACVGIQMETVEDRIGPHKLRHTFLSHMLSNGADLVVVADAAGHADVQTTLGYAKNIDDDLITKFHKRMG